MIQFIHSCPINLLSRIKKYLTVFLVFFNLDLTATADSVPLTETESVFEELNKACYGAFVDWINDDILKLMEKEGDLHETLQQ